MELISLTAPTETEITAMASITIRNLDDEIKQRLAQIAGQELGAAADSRVHLG